MFSLGKANKLLPKIIEKNNIFRNKLKNKFKASEIFYELENKASSQLMEMIRLSERRNNDIRTGSLLSSVLNRSSERATVLSSKIVNDPYFINSGKLEKEKQKLKANVTKELEEEVSSLIDQMKTGKPEKTTPTKTNVTQTNNEFKSLSKKEKLKRNEELISSVMEKDIQKINNSVDLYLNEMNNLYKSCDEDEEFRKKVKKGSDLVHYKRKIPTPSIRNITSLLYRNPENLEKVVLSKSQSDSNLFNIKKLLPFTRLGILAKQRNDRKNPSALLENLNQEKIISLINENNSFNDYGNTSKVVVNQAVKNYSLEENFFRKSRELDALLDRKLPSFEEYNKIIKQKITAFKLGKENKRKRMISETTSNQESNENTLIPSQSIKDKDTNFEQAKAAKIKEEIKELIEGAKKMGDDYIQVGSNKKSAENESFTFLSSVPKRVINQYCDGYSMREGRVNTMLKNLIPFLSKNQLTKNQIDKKIDSYYRSFSKVEEKKKDEELKLYIKKVNNEERRKVAMKLKDNLKKAELPKMIEKKDSEEGDINVNYSGFFDKSGKLIRKVRRTSMGVNGNGRVTPLHLSEREMKKSQSSKAILDSNSRASMRRRESYREFLDLKKRVELKESKAD